MTALKTARVILNDLDVRAAIAQYIGKEIGTAPASESVKVMYFHEGMAAWGSDDCEFRVEMTVNL